MTDQDIQFFQQHPTRKAHIRKPRLEPMRDTQRAVRILDECELEFRSLGGHDRDRRRILLCRTDHRGNWLPEHKILKIPFLAFSDETIEDTDETLLPIIFTIMAEAAEQGSAR